MPEHKLFIDECLSPKLVQHAIKAGFYHTTCVRDRGLSGISDAKLAQLLAKENYILITHNSIDFRGHPPGSGGLYKHLAIHSGLICLNSELTISRAIMTELFSAALNKLIELPDLINHAMEVTLKADHTIEIMIYGLSSHSDF
ncbi:MAG: hypothetical protein CL536_02190 [Alcaligenaceae bacterium]|jgi:predicted nuclease of predicted toxin-antitoxin system|nr:hypothetical protein [Alcaligenaceae bacterium]